jgi:phage terminase large subunit-like protein
MVRRAKAQKHKHTKYQPIQYKKKTKEDENKHPPLPLDDPGFEKFCKYLSYPAYKGLFEWQKREHELTKDAKYSMTLVHRKSGKSVLFNNKYQYRMKYRNYDILLLGWTARYKEIAVYVYNFFEFHGLIDRDKRTSPFHFRTKDGGQFDCYLITSKDTLGKHSEGLQDRYENMTQKDWEEYKALFQGNFENDENRVFTEKELQEFVDSRKGTERKLWISIDDPIDMSFKKERHKEESLELHFNSTLLGIQPDKWSFTGTRKFEGDFFDFIQSKFKDDLVAYIRGTRDLDGTLLCPEMFTHPDESTYEADIKDGKEDLGKLREHVGEYVWHSDFEQNPHPVAGEVWDHIKFRYILDTPLVRKHDLCFITIDRATTRVSEARTKKADFTGCLIGVREKKTGRRIITHDFTGYIDIDTLLNKVNEFVIEFKSKYRQMRIVLIVEKQGGGSDFITLAKKSSKFINSNGEAVDNKIPELCVIEEIHNTGEKLQRIKDRLGAPLKNERIELMSTLKNSEIATEILDFPHSAKLDAIDGLANSEFIILEKYPVAMITGDPIKELTLMYKKAHEPTKHELYKGPNIEGLGKSIIEDW